MPSWRCVILVILDRANRHNRKRRRPGLGTVAEEMKVATYIV